MDGDESQTVREDILAAMETVNEQVEVEPEVTQQEVVTAAEEEKPSGRDDKGRFAKKEEAPEVQEEIEAEGDIPEINAEDKKPPQALAATIKAKWGELPPEIKNEFIRLEQSSAKGVAKIQEEARTGRELLSEFEPYRALMQSAGGTPQTVIRNLLNTAAILRTGTQAQKQQAVHSIIQEYGVPMGAIPQTQHDPLAPVMNEVQWLKQQLQLQQQTRQQQEESQLLTVVNQFLEEADEKGSQKHPLDESLEAEFADEITSVRARNPNLNNREVLEKAYERMSWKVPEIRQTLLERQNAEQEAKRKENAAQLVAKKQAAAVSVKGSAANNTPAQPDSLRDLIASQVYGTSGRI